jgi:hypothetical protein
MLAYNYFLRVPSLVLNKARTQEELLSLELLQVLLIDVLVFGSSAPLSLRLTSSPIIIHLPSLCIDHILCFLSAQLHSKLLSLLQRVLVLCYIHTIMISSLLIE